MAISDPKASEALRDGDASPRKAYARPGLEFYGQILGLTRNGQGSGNDGGSVTKSWMGQSDARLKTNVRHVGRHPAGFGLYLFDYLPEFQAFGAGRQFGVIAQEVEQVIPGAVHVGEDGYRCVDYRMLGIRRRMH